MERIHATPGPARYVNAHTNSPGEQQNPSQSREVFSAFIYRESSCACGGSCPSCQAGGGNLRISQPNDAAEIEADAVANRVMRMSVYDPEPKSNLSRTPDAIHRKCDSGNDGEDKGTILRRPLSSGVAAPSQSPEHVRNAINSSARPLDLETRNFFEPRLGYDLGGVRIHTDSDAAQSASRIDARAYTVGSDIVFGGGEYKPETQSGKTLLAHELAHTIQQADHSNTIRRAPNFGTGTDGIHGDLLDQYTRETGQSRDAVTQYDPGYEAWILAGALSVDKTTYLGLINSAIGRMSGNLVDNETLATTAAPILRAMAGNPIWKDSRGHISGGGSISHTIGTNTLHLTLILNDDPDPLRPAGLFNHGTSATDASIEVRRRFSQAPYLAGRGIPRASVTWTPPPLVPPTFRPLPLP